MASEIITSHRPSDGEEPAVKVSDQKQDEVEGLTHSMGEIDLDVEKDDESNDCPICLDAMDDEQERFVTVCLHTFHKICIKKVTDDPSNSCCPLCRRSLLNPPAEQSHCLVMQKMKRTRRQGLNPTPTERRLREMVRDILEHYRIRDQMYLDTAVMGLVNYMHVQIKTVFMYTIQDAAKDINHVTGAALRSACGKDAVELALQMYQAHEVHDRWKSMFKVWLPDQVIGSELFKLTACAFTIRLEQIVKDAVTLVLHQNHHVVKQVHFRMAIAMHP